MRIILAPLYPLPLRPIFIQFFLEHMFLLLHFSSLSNPLSSSQAIFFVAFPSQLLSRYISLSFHNLHSHQSIAISHTTQIPEQLSLSLHPQKIIPYLFRTQSSSPHKNPFSPSPFFLLHGTESNELFTYCRLCNRARTIW